MFILRLEIRVPLFYFYSFFLKAHTAEVMRETPFKVEFGFLTPGQVYCAVANFTAEGVLTSSPPSLPQCVYIPAKRGVYHFYTKRFYLFCGVMNQGTFICLHICALFAGTHACVCLCVLQKASSS